MEPVSTTLGSIGHLLNIAKAIVNTRDTVKLGELQIDFNSALLDLQSKQITIAQKLQSIVDENDLLKKQCASMDRWNTESNRYQLQAIETGVFVYALKTEHKESAPPHWLCATCYADGVKSIMVAIGQGHHKCPREVRHNFEIDYKKQPNYGEGW